MDDARLQKHRNRSNYEQSTTSDSCYSHHSQRINTHFLSLSLLFPSGHGHLHLRLDDYNETNYTENGPRNDFFVAVFCQQTGIVQFMPESNSVFLYEQKISRMLDGKHNLH